MDRFKRDPSSWDTWHDDEEGATAEIRQPIENDEDAARRFNDDRKPIPEADGRRWYHRRTTAREDAKAAAAIRDRSRWHDDV